MRAELPRLTFGNYVRPGESADIGALAGRMAALLDPGLSWADVDWLRGLWRGPLLLKGILHPAEAREAAARGVDGVIVSNHGGRQLDGAAASFDALPGRRRRRSRGGFPCCWTAASGAAPTWSRRWRSAPPAA